MKKINLNHKGIARSIVCLRSLEDKEKYESEVKYIYRELHCKNECDIHIIVKLDAILIGIFKKYYEKHEREKKDLYLSRMLNGYGILYGYYHHDFISDTGDFGDFYPPKDRVCDFFKAYNISSQEMGTCKTVGEYCGKSSTIERILKHILSDGKTEEGLNNFYNTCIEENTKDGRPLLPHYPDLWEESVILLSHSTRPEKTKTPRTVKKSFTKDDVSAAQDALLNICLAELQELDSKSSPTSMESEQPIAHFKRYLDNQKSVNMTLAQLNEAAKSGDPKDQYKAGSAYYQNLRDEEAVRYFELAADQGYAPGQAMLGFLYFTGRGVQINGEKAYLLAKASAEQGDPHGECFLGYFYECGICVDPYLETAEKWYKLSIDHGCAEAKARYGQLLFHDPERAELGCNLMLEAYKEGCTMAAYYIAFVFLKSGDFETAAKCLHIAGEAGFAGAWELLGYLYEEGKFLSDFTPDFNKALGYYEKAKNLNSAVGKCFLGQLYLKRHSTEEDTKQGIYWLEQSSMHGYFPASQALATLYYEGKYVKRDFEKYKKWLKITAEQDI